MNTACWRAFRILDLIWLYYYERADEAGTFGAPRRPPFETRWAGDWRRDQTNALAGLSESATGATELAEFETGCGIRDYTIRGKPPGVDEENPGSISRGIGDFRLLAIG